MREIWGAYTPDTLLADLHLHTNCSDGRLTPQEVIDQSVARGLNAIAITDHDNIDPAERAKSYCQDKGLDLQVIVGAEISTEFRRHLLGLDLYKNISSGKPLEWTIEAIHDQNGLVVVPHPMYAWTASLTQRQIMQVLFHPAPMIYFDGFEIFNAGVEDNTHTRANQNAQKFYEDHKEQLGAAIGSTDTHYFMIGRGLTGFQGNLREAILSRKTSVLALEESEVIKMSDFLYQQYRGLLALPVQSMKRMISRRWKLGIEN